MRNNKRIHKYVWDSENGKRLNYFGDDERIAAKLKIDILPEKEKRKYDTVL